VRVALFTFGRSHIFSPIKKHTQPPNADARAAVQSLHPQTPIGRVRLDAGDVQQVSFCD
jgi:hypothetical protein